MHFTSTDLVRIHLVEVPDPMWETVFSLQMLRARYGRLAFAEWRQLVRRDLQRNVQTRDMRQLFPLVPDASYFPDFLTPAEGLLGLEAGIEAIAATPPARISRELSLLSEQGGTPAWAGELTDRSSHARERLGRMLSGYHTRALTPYWPTIRRRAATDHAMRIRLLRTAGVEHLLDSFRPAMQWRPPVLEIPGYPVNRDLYLQHRGLLLVPSHFCWHHPVTLADAELPPTLLYPLGRDVDWMRPAAYKAESSDADPLSRLIGGTRAAVLRATAPVPNTSDLATRVGITAAAASQHTAVLREAGLITSHRHANSVFHQPTPLGTELLRRHAVLTAEVFAGAAT